MIVYVTAFINTDGNPFPDTKAVNASGPSAIDGTEFVKIMVDDEWGARQALMDYAGLTPNSVTEGPGASQALEAMIKGLAVGPGIGVIYWKNDDPATLGDRVLLLTGQGILRSSYSELDDAVYVGDTDNPTASAFYHADDAAGTIRNTTGIYLILPDLRGYTLRGLDVAAAVDPDGASRDLGHVQNDAFQGHFHDMPDGYVDLGAGTNAIVSGSFYPLNFSTGSPITDGVNGTPRTSSESRMINVATNYGITY